MQFKTTSFFALFVNTTATGDIQTYNCGMSFVFRDFTLHVIAEK